MSSAASTHLPQSTQADRSKSRCFLTAASALLAAAVRACMFIFPWSTGGSACRVAQETGRENLTPTNMRSVGPARRAGGTLTRAVQAIKLRAEADEAQRKGTHSVVAI